MARQFDTRDTPLGVREQRRATHRSSQCRERLHAQLRKGQTLVIFVLSFTVLLGLAGLSIDVARAYDLYGRMQRAAEAGALAGVLYMPVNYNINYSDGNNAIKRALQ
jgi:Flp pilus assembly protein TadG